MEHYDRFRAKVILKPLQYALHCRPVLPPLTHWSFCLSLPTHLSSHQPISHLPLRLITFYPIIRLSITNDPNSLSTDTSIQQSSTHPSTRLPSYLPSHSSVVHLLNHPSTHSVTPAYLTIYPFTPLSIHPSTCPSTPIYPSP